MRSFAIDIYLWYEEAGLWLFVPPCNSPVIWTIKFSQSKLLTCEAGITFRIDDVLWLTNERDIFPLEIVVFDLENTIIHNDISERLLAEMRVSEFQSIQIKQKADGTILLSRLNTRQDKDYFEEVANFVGTYYKDFPVECEMWKNAVNMAIDGLSKVFGESYADILLEDNALASCLLQRFQKLNTCQDNYG
jgi:hypothetical protein